MTMQRERSRGFTLIEMIVVLTIMGLALTIVARVLPRQNNGLQLASTSQQVVNMLRLARAKAIAESRPVIVEATRDGHGMAVNGVAQIFAPAVTLSMTGRVAIRFSPDGSASGGAIRVQGESRAQVVDVDWLTGRARVSSIL